MDANVIIDNLIERIGVLIKENAFLTAKVHQYENDLKNAIKEIEEDE